MTLKSKLLLRPTITKFILTHRYRSFWSRLDCAGRPWKM